MLLPWQIEKILQDELASPKFAKCKPVFCESVEEFVRTNIIDKVVALRVKYGLDAATTEPPKRAGRAKKIVEDGK
jgi:hypothetical protein